VTHKIGIGVS